MSCQKFKEIINKKKPTEQEIKEWRKHHEKCEICQAAVKDHRAASFFDWALGGARQHRRTPTYGKRSQQRRRSPVVCGVVVFRNSGNNGFDRR